MTGQRLQHLVQINRLLPIPGFDCPVTERFAAVWHDEAEVEVLLIAQPIAFWAGPMWAVEGKEPWGELGIADAAGNTGEFLAEDELAAVHRIDSHDAVGEVHRGLDGIRQALLNPRLDD